MANLDSSTILNLQHCPLFRVKVFKTGAHHRKHQEMFTETILSSTTSIPLCQYTTHLMTVAMDNLQ